MIMNIKQAYNIISPKVSASIQCALNEQRWLLLVAWFSAGQLPCCSPVSHAGLGMPRRGSHLQQRSDS